MAEIPTPPLGDPCEESTRSKSALKHSGFSMSHGSYIGFYKLLQQVGEGGFGIVWLAERREPFTQRVALKLIKPGMDSQEVLARFEQERQALAVMNHPNIARVFDAGATDRGLPYFVMEHVQGEAITTYCDRHRLSIADRLRLFITVCEAVQHAHMKGIIHRDIKPGNILVAPGDDGPVVKVIDFGVAKALSHTLTQRTIFTEIGRLIGTPEYMSPEQAEMGATDIDTRTDVYSLGVLLYELLTGAPPFDSRTLREAGYAEMQRYIREVEPPKPSTRFSSLGEQSADIAAHRRARCEELSRQLSRELDWIPLKAMRKDRAERYRTPTDVADDIRNYLEGRPLEAGPEAAIYRLRKFVHRNRGPVLSAGLIACVLIVGLVGTAAQTMRLSAERSRALDQLSTSLLLRTLSQSIDASTMADLEHVAAICQELGDPLDAKAVLARWMQAELLREEGQCEEAVAIFEGLAGDLSRIERSGSALEFVADINKVLPWLNGAGSFEDVSMQIGRGAVVAIAAQSRWDEAIRRGRIQLSALGSRDDLDELRLNAHKDLAHLLARNGQHQEAIVMWDDFVKKASALGLGEVYSGLFSAYSKGMTLHSIDFHNLKLDLIYSMAAVGRPEEAAGMALFCESAWRQAASDALPRQEQELAGQGFRLLPAVASYRRHSCRSGWSDPVALLVKLYDDMQDSEQAAIWKSREAILHETGVPPRRWPGE